MSEKARKSGMITVELGLSLVLIAVVLFVTLGLFSDNLQQMFSASNFKNIFNGNAGRTFFAFFNKDYSNSQVSVQIMGEQGLEMLRQKANNNNSNDDGTGLIEQAISAKAAGKDTTQLANTISYLGLVINVIVGDSQNCKFMNLPSKEKCGNGGVPAGKYKLDINGNNLNITGLSDDAQSIQLKTSVPAPASLLANIDPNRADLKTKLQTLSTLNSDYKGSINSSYALTRDVNYFLTNVTAGTPSSSGGSLSTPEQKLMAVMTQTQNDFTDAYGKCKGNLFTKSLYQLKGVCNWGDDNIHKGDKDAIKNKISDINNALVSLGQQTDSIIKNAPPKTTSTAQVTTQTTTSTTTSSTTSTATKTYIGTKNDIEIEGDFAMNYNPSQLIVAGTSAIKGKHSGLIQAAEAADISLKTPLIAYQAQAYCIDADRGQYYVGDGREYGYREYCTQQALPYDQEQADPDSTVDSTVTKQTLTCQDLSDCHIDSSLGDIPVVDTTLTNGTPCKLEAAYVLSPLVTPNDRRLSATNLTTDTRENVLVKYAEMVNSLFTSDSGRTVLEILSRAPYMPENGKRNLCQVYLNTLKTTANSYGLITVTNNIDTQLSNGTCQP